MSQRNLIRAAVRFGLMTGAAVAAAGYAATASAANANSPAKLHKVTVTGTHIKRTNIETAQPITRISRQQIQRSGYTNIGDFLGRLTFSGSHGNSAGFYGGGGTNVNLRGLGTNRTLVLVNGKRWMQGLGGVSNVNNIPTSIIDHIEVLQDGASAIYGSDAIAGVVNIITIKNFRGAEGHAYYGIHNGDGHWDGQTKQYDFTIGGGNDRGNVVFNATYREQNEILRSERKLTSTPVAGELPYVGGAAYTPSGRFRFFGKAVSGKTFGQGTCGTYNPAQPANVLCDFTLQNAPAKPSLQNFRNFQPTDLYNLRGLSHLLLPLKDVSTYVQGHYDLFDNVTFTANAEYIREESKNRRPKEEVFVGSNTPATRWVNNAQPIGIAASNPYNPFGVDLVSDTTDPCIAAGSCIGLASVGRQALEMPFRIETFDTDFFHIFAGFNGFVNLFHREIDWDVGFAQNRQQAAGLEIGVSNNARVQKALGPASQCTAPCVPLNVFGGSAPGGGGTIAQNQINYINYENHDINQSNLRDWTANISSDVYDLPAGPLGVAIGYERIDNYGYTHPDALVVEGNNSDGSGVPTTGRIVRDAEYAELNIPLLADLPGAQSLSVDVANRWTQFKRSGVVNGQDLKSFVHNSSGRLNIRWQPINDLLLRASWSQGFRSPNVPELFGGQSAPYFYITDPCAPGPYGGYRGGPLPSNCPGGTLDVQPTREIHGIGGSNAQLKPEKSISRTFGFVYSPHQVPGLDVNADYYKIEITNQVGTVGNQNIVNGCFYNNSFCDLITLRGGQITSIRNVNTNVGDLLTEGVDVGLHYKFPSTPFGDFTARIAGTFLRKWDSSVVNRATKTGFATNHLAGFLNLSRRRFNGDLNWSYGNWSAHYRIEYIDHALDRCGVASVEDYCTYPNRTTNYQGVPGQWTLGEQHLGATTYHDVNVTYTVPSINTTFGIGVNNLFDKKPPITGGGTIATGYYRLPSRFLYGDIRVRF
jgi:outer membrane receptor protein involved in Fe transport